MNTYKLTLLVKNELDEKKRKELLDDVVKSFGKVTREDLWGNRAMTYPISKQTQAFYAHYEFESDPSSIFGLDKKLKLNEDVIRFLLLKTEQKTIKYKKVTKKEVKASELTEEVLKKE